jgi:coenzyme F420-reducing hydrogenase delta subunit
VAVMQALNKVAEANKKELVELERTSSENARKLQKQLNSYSNQVRDLGPLPLSPSRNPKP